MTDRTPLTGEWRGETTYLCPFCPYDTLNEEAINDHLRGAHPIPEGADPVEEAEAVADPVEEQAPEAPPVEETPEPEPEPESTPAPDVPVAPPPANTDDDE